MEEILHHLGCIKPVVNDGRNYQPQQVQDFFHQQYDWMSFFFSMIRSFPGYASIEFGKFSPTKMCF